MVSFKNNGRLKLLIIVGTRPEIIRLSAVIKRCRKTFDTLLAHTGQNYDYELNGIFSKIWAWTTPMSIWMPWEMTWARQWAISSTAVTN